MDKQVVFKSPGNHGEVGRHDGEWYTISAGHRLCTELAEEIERLRARHTDYIDTIAAMLKAAGVDPDADDSLGRLNTAGPKPSHFIAELKRRADDADLLREEVARLRRLVDSCMDDIVA